MLAVADAADKTSGQNDSETNYTPGFFSPSLLLSAPIQTRWYLPSSPDFLAWLPAPFSLSASSIQAPGSLYHGDQAPLPWILSLFPDRFLFFLSLPIIDNGLLTPFPTLVLIPVSPSGFF